MNDALPVVRNLESDPITPADVIARWSVVDAPDEAAWKLARHGLLTASDVAGVMGLDPHKSRAKVMAAKRAPEPPDVFVSSAMRGGQFLEDGVFRWWLDDLSRHNRKLGVAAPMGSTCRTTSGVSMLVRHPDPTLRLGASPDGLVLDGDVPTLVEVKVTNARRWADSWGPANMKLPRAWGRYSDVDAPSVGKCPLRHWVQLQTQLYVCGIEWGVIVGCCGTERLDYHFEADVHFQECIAHEVRRFWLDTVSGETQVAEA